MATLPQIRPGAANTTGLPTTGSIIGNVGASTALSDGSALTFDGQNTNSSGTYQHGRELENTPADFSTMSTLTIQYRRGWESAVSNTTWDSLSARIMAANGTTVLAAGSAGGAFQLVDTSITDIGSTLGTTQPFTYVNTGATKAQWDGAIVQTQWVRTRSKGGDSVGARVYEAGINGTYTPAASPGVLNQAGWRLRDDDGSESAATWKAANNVVVAPVLDENLRIRIAVENTDATNPSPSGSYFLYYSKNGGAWTQVTGASSNARMATSVHFPNTAPTTDQAVGGAGSFVAGLIYETDATASQTLAASSHTELEWCLQLRSADLAESDTMKFRVWKNGAALSGAYTQDGLTLTVPGTPTIEVTDWRIYQDGAEASSPALGVANNQGAVVDFDTPFLVRFLVKNTGAGPATFQPKLQRRYMPPETGGVVDWEPNRGLPDSPTEITFAQMADLTAASTHANAVASGTISDNAATTQRLGVGTFVAGKVDTGDGAFAASWTIPAGQETEVVFCVELDSTDFATVDDKNNQYEVQFRPVDDISEALYDVYNNGDSASGEVYARVNPPWTWANDLEAGTSGNSLSTADANSPDGWDGINVNAGALIEYFDSNPHTGSLHGIIDDSSGANLCRIRWHDFNQGIQLFGRVYVYPISNGTQIINFLYATGGYNNGDEDLFMVDYNTDRTLTLQDKNGTTIGSTVALTNSPTEYYRIEFGWRPESATDAGDGFLELRLFEGDSTTALSTITDTTALSGTEFEDLDFGPRRAADTMVMYFDEIAFSNADWVGPATADKAGAGSATSNSSDTHVTVPAKSGSGTASSNSTATGTGIAAEPHSGSGTATSNSSGTGSGVGSVTGAPASATSNSSAVGSGVAAEAASGSGTTTSNSSAAASGAGQRSGAGTATSNSTATGSGVGFEAHTGSGSATSNSTAVPVGTSNRDPPGDSATSNTSAVGSGVATVGGPASATSNSSAVGSGVAAETASGSGSSTSNSSEIASGTKAVSGTGTASSDSSDTHVAAKAASGSGTATSDSSAAGSGTPAEGAVGSGSATSNSTATASGVKAASGTGAASSDSSAVGSGAAVEAASGSGTATSNSSEISSGTKAGSGAGTATSNSTAVGSGVPAEGVTGTGVATSNSAAAASGTKSASGSGSASSDSSTVPLGGPADSGVGTATSNSSATHVTTSARSGSGTATSNSAAVGSGVAAEGAVGFGAATSNSTATAATGVKDILGTASASSDSSATGSGSVSEASSGSGSADSNSSVTHVTAGQHAGSGTASSNSSATATGVAATGAVGTGSATSNSSDTYVTTSARSGSGTATSNSAAVATGIPASGDPGNETSGSGASGTGQKNAFGAGTAASNSDAAGSGTALEAVSGTGTATSNSSASGAGTPSVAADLTASSESSYTAVGTKSASGSGSATSQDSGVGASASAVRPYTMTTDPVPRSVVTILNNRSVVSIRRTP